MRNAFRGEFGFLLLLLTLAIVIAPLGLGWNILAVLVVWAVWFILLWRITRWREKRHPDDPLFAEKDDEKSNAALARVLTVWVGSWLNQIVLKALGYYLKEGQNSFNPSYSLVVYGNIWFGLALSLFIEVIFWYGLYCMFKVVLNKISQPETEQKLDALFRRLIGRNE